MNNNFLLTITLGLIGLLALACGGAGGLTGGGGDMNGIFADMESGIRNTDEDLFKKHWHPTGYSENLVGGSGLSGKRMFDQGSRKKWFPKPDLGNTQKLGRVEIVPTELYNWERERKVDEVYFAVAADSGGLKILGGGEDREEVRALAERFNAGKSLVPEE